MARISFQGVEYDFSVADITNDEGMAIENQMDCTFDQWSKLLATGSLRAMTSWGWLLQHRDNPSLRLSDVHFTIGEMPKPVVDPDDEDTEPVPVTEVVPGGTNAVVESPKEVASESPEEVSTSDDPNT